MTSDKHSRGRPHVYLEDIPLDEATSRFHSALQQSGGLSRIGSERVALDLALHRVTADPVFGKSNLMFALIRADGLAKVPLDKAGMTAGESVEITLF